MSDMNRSTMAGRSMKIRLLRGSGGQEPGSVFCEGIQAAGVVHVFLPVTGAKCRYLPKSGEIRLLWRWIFFSVGFFS